MKFHKRKNLRISGYDYSRYGPYFVTICARQRECIFGEVVNAEMRANRYGQIVQEEWVRSAQIRREMQLDEFIVMPNHVHGIVAFDFPVGASGARPDYANGNFMDRATGRSPLQRGRGPSEKSLAAFIAGFKSAVTKRINEIRNTPAAAVWQRNYYEHIIRDEDELDRIREYVFYNASKWETDRENPDALKIKAAEKWMV